jgi:hypothetical protein
VSKARGRPDGDHQGFSEVDAIWWPNNGGSSRAAAKADPAIMGEVNDGFHDNFAVMRPMGQQTRCK